LDHEAKNLQPDRMTQGTELLRVAFELRGHETISNILEEGPQPVLPKLSK
jgi:hypothetical protein